VGCKLRADSSNPNPKSVPHMGSENERLGTSMRGDRVLCYEDHTVMLLKSRSDPVETFLYACQEPGCFVCYDSSQGYFVDRQGADTVEQEIKPRVNCPHDGHPMYLAEVRSERKSFRQWKCPECNTMRTNGELSGAAASSG
jgi:hypothetical protein